LHIELRKIILGNDFVSREAINIDRNILYITDISIRRIDIIIRSKPIVGNIESLKTNIAMFDTNMLAHTISKEAFTSTFASPPRCEKLFPRKRVLPLETPRSIMAEKMIVTEMTVEEIPIISEVVNLGRISHKTNPKTMPIMLSM